jgi:hypothetical protein
VPTYVQWVLRINVYDYGECARNCGGMLLRSASMLIYAMATIMMLEIMVMIPVSRHVIKASLFVVLMPAD